MRLIFFSRVNGEISESVWISRMRLFRLALVTRPTAPSVAAIDSESQTSSSATTPNTAIIAIVANIIRSPCSMVIW